MKLFINGHQKWLLLAILSSLAFISPTNSAPSLTSRLKGYILLQVEENGEAWYIIPTEQKKVYMRDGGVAYQIMRELSLGITDANLAKIPVGIETRFNEQDTDDDGLSDKLEEGLGTDPSKVDTDADGFNDGAEIKDDYNPLNKQKLIYDQALVNRLSGYILLQVEKQGQAWYLNPKDGKRYYMRDGDTAYQIMRFLSLGITNQNLNLIPTSNRSFSVVNPPNDNLPGDNTTPPDDNATSTPPTTPPSTPPGGGGGGGSTPPSTPPTADTNAPTVPTNLSASASGSQISISWAASSDAIGVVGYMVWRSTTNGGPYSTFIASSNTNSYTQTGLTAGTYYYVVRAYDAAFNYSANSSQASGVITVVSDTVAPTVPTNLSASASGTQIALTWTASTDATGVTGYNILRSTTNGGPYSSLTTSATNLYTNTGLTNNTYYYVVQAYDALGNTSTNSNQATAIVNVMTPPSNGGPVISGISGTMVAGSAVTISGSGFGTKSTPAPLKWDTFEAGAAYPTDTMLDTIQPEWVKMYSASLGGAMYTNRQKHSGVRSVYNTVDRPGSGLFIVDGQEQLRGQWETNYFRTPLSNTLFLSYWYRMESNPTGGGAVKMSRITSSEAAGGGGIYNMQGSMAMGGQPPCHEPFFDISNDTDGGRIDLGNTYFSWGNCNEWVRQDMGRTLNDVGVDNGWIFADIVGYERQNWDNIQNIFNTGPFDGKSLQLDTALLGLMIANFGVGENTAMFIDDVYIDNTRAKVEIGNNSVYTSCNHREMQIPTTWSASGDNIQFTVNRGSFISGQSVYLFVMNEDGTASSGYGPIVIQ